jgi:hypothetical protein
MLNKLSDWVSFAVALAVALVLKNISCCSALTARRSSQPWLPLLCPGYSFKPAEQQVNRLLFVVKRQSGRMFRRLGLLALLLLAGLRACVYLWRLFFCRQVCMGSRSQALFMLGT